MIFINCMISGFVSIFAPIQYLWLWMVAFTMLDFLTGCWADLRREDKKGNKWYFQSDKGWWTIIKVTFEIVAVSGVWILENRLIGNHEPYFTKFVTVFICGIEFWSFLENAGDLSEAAIFKKIKKFTISKVSQEIGCEEEDIKELLNDENKEKDA